jgi:hypothetical protein
MEQDGLIAARVVQQERRPNKRLFSPTEAGLAALHGFNRRAPRRPTAIRDEMVKVRAVDVGDASAVQASSPNGRNGPDEARQVRECSVPGSSMAVARKSTWPTPNESAPI